MNQPIAETTVEELAQCLLSTGRHNIQLLDVREPQEIAIARIDGFINIPLSKVAQWSEEVLSKLDPHMETLVLCHHGIRSAQMCQWLVSQGFTNVKNIAGGIHAYSSLIDNSIPQY
ncbi:hypothetical protein RINTHM_3860 [Richelia intracellularis HM01]|uniref:rhodanese-like domain-containing protein n=1 Tax=Richelia intracellularis TaxID=1164990 RepID=UPI0002B59E76|nr:rhodanese-like domain-containing protein [Richelia intracellularis]CCH64856.1 hypothetical protein RINTHM_3860 [Richelia intracellularis HM01]